MSKFSTPMSILWQYFCMNKIIIWLLTRFTTPLEAWTQDKVADFLQAVLPYETSAYGTAVKSHHTNTILYAFGMSGNSKLHLFQDLASILWASEMKIQS